MGQMDPDYASVTISVHTKGLSCASLLEEAIKFELKAL